MKGYIQKKLDMQAVKMSKRFKIMMKNKEVAQWQTMIEWLEKKLKPVSAMLTRNHHKIVRQFLAYKERTEQKLLDLDESKSKMIDAEIALAQRNPLYEAEYKLDEDNPLKLFDCFVPSLEEHRLMKHMTMI